MDPPENVVLLISETVKQFSEFFENELSFLLIINRILMALVII